MGLIRPRIAATKPETVSRLLLEMIRATADLQRREHLTFLLAVYEVVMVLHGNEGRQVVFDCIVLHSVD